MMKRSKIISSIIVFLILLLGCKSAFNMKSEHKNLKKADQIFETNFSKNGNAFYYSIGTIGYKYIWTYSQRGTIDLTTIDLSGNIEQKGLNYSENWTTSADTDFEKLKCLEVLDGDVLKIKFKNGKNEIFNQFLIYDFKCLSEQNNPIIKHLIQDMKLLKIK